MKYRLFLREICVLGVAMTSTAGTLQQSENVRAFDAAVAQVSAHMQPVDGLSDEGRDLLATVDLWLQGTVWRDESMLTIENALTWYLPAKKMTRDTFVEASGSVLGVLLASRDESDAVKRYVANASMAVAFSGASRAEQILVDALFAEWNPDRHTLAYNLVEMSPEAAMRLLGRAVDDPGSLDVSWQAYIFNQVAKCWLLKEDALVSPEVRKAMIKSLRKAADGASASLPGCGLERILMKADPEWRSSSSREALAKRMLATYVEAGGEQRWPELAQAMPTDATPEVIGNVRRFFSAALADVETARKEAAEKEAKPAEAQP